MTFLLPGSAPARSAVVNTAKGTVKTVAAATTKTVDTLSGLPTIFKGSEGSLGRIRSNEVGAVGDLDNLPPAALGTYTDDFSVAAVPDAVTPSSINVQLDQPATATRQVGPVVIEELPTQPLPENMRNVGEVPVIPALSRDEAQLLLSQSNDEFTYFARGDINRRDTFLSSLAEERGVEASRKSYLDAESNGLLDDLFDRHGNLGSQGLPTIGVSRDVQVAEYFARGPQQTQAGHVTVFKMKTDDFNKLAERNFENRRDVFDINPNIGKPEQEYLFNTQIDSKYVVGQYQVATNKAVDGVVTSNSISQKISEAGYLSRIERLESIYGSQGVHSIEKHGAQTTGMKQYRRVQHKDYPNPTTGAPGNKTKTASKFLTHKDHYEILRSAILQRKMSPEVNDFEVVLNRNIGVNIKNLGTHKDRGPYSAEYTNTAIVRFDPNTGKMFTAFPIPRKN